MRIAGLLIAAWATSLLACAQQVTYSEHVAPILQARCQSCHRPGQIAPMSLLTYADARAYSGLIRQSIEMGNMPPFYAAGPIGYFKDDMRLTPEEKETIFAWVDGGTPEGDPAQLPTPIEWEDSPWPLGEPDLVVHFPRHSPPPVRKDHFITLVSDYVFEEEMWVQAFHLKTESKTAVHHSTQFLWDHREPVPEGGKTLFHVKPWNALFTWFPGFHLDPLPAGQAFRLRAGSQVASRTHFGPTADKVSEQMDLGIYFADGPIDSIQKPLGGQMLDIKIPPGDPHYVHRKKLTFGEDALVSHFRIHMHLRGKAAQIIFHYPDGSEELVFDLPRFRFQWQRYYYLADPLPVPAGTVAEFVGIWDNSANNPYNPDPTVWCRWGKRTVDEMFGGTVFYTPQKKLEHPLQVVKGRHVGGELDARLGTSPLL
jgi:hypothetical protein